ncbi:ganglioside GM2 activator-like [Actinia tenebrosa]|uniref:Ganglioside GM2 activator-like n=1 Tax=Actinia tenebrosa TaxID=6105 RepID=A0A6P8J8N3_ACTTE|nr:ganglioside GM2 activator-like [Actinia tenebrosa]
MASFKQACFLLVVCIFAVDAFSWKNCDRGAPVQVKKVTLSPTPVRLYEGAKITFGGSAEIKGNAGVNYKVELSIKRKAGSWVPIWVPIPCISNVGSCTYTGLSCSKIWKKLNKPAQCPVPAGSHNLPTTTITLPKVDLPSFLTSGTYWARAKLINTDNRRVMACVEIDIKIR